MPLVSWIVLSRRRIKSRLREILVGRLTSFFGIGFGLRRFWLGRGSRLDYWFYERGVCHQDEMSGLILEAFWLQLRGERMILGYHSTPCRGAPLVSDELDVSTCAVAPLPGIAHGN